MSYQLDFFTRRWKMIVSAGLLFALASVFVSLLFPLKYRADAQVLIISKSRYGVDPYTVVKSAERVAENIIEIMKTSDFYHKVRAQEGYAIDWSAFDELDERDRRKLWDTTMKPSVVYGTGVLNVSVFNQDKSRAADIADASAQALAQKGWEYVGGDVTIKLVNSPIVSRWPVRPNMVFNAALGFISGILLMSLMLYRRG